MALTFSNRNLFANALDRLSKLIGFGGESKDQVGSQRPYQFEVGTDETYQGRYFDFEIPQLGAVRDPDRAFKLWNMRFKCSEAATAINALTDDAISHVSGDSPITVDAYVDAGKTIAIDPETKQIVEKMIYEKFTPTTIRAWIDEYLSFGDCFVEIVFNSDFSGIHSFVHLPCWELFRIEDNHAMLLAFEQRKYLADSSHTFHPLQIMHFRYQRLKLYGRALFEESLPDWDGLQDAETDWARGTRELGLNPLIHKMPECEDVNYRQTYIKLHKAKMKQGPIAHYYLDAGGSIESAMSSPPNLSYLRERVDQKRREIFQRARIPPWLVGLPSEGAKEVAGLPGESYARHVNAIRQVFTETISYAIEIELALKGIDLERGRFRLVYPPIVVNPYGTQNNGQQQQQQTNVRPSTTAAATAN